MVDGQHLTALKNTTEVFKIPNVNETLNTENHVDIIGGSADGAIFGTTTTESPQVMIEQIMKHFEEHDNRIDQIIGSPVVFKAIDMRMYSQKPYKPSATPTLILRMFKMSILLNIMVPLILEIM
ncbi:hypothetical protein HAX54_012497 [Datura stramonium]|uniref:Uncharacterized protein n=1 Tax=Datura stramonium TaxID=4076 RepID=A0ABS8TJX2_DATST|nr:hypothetical protein [Datura stramonium]